MQTQLDTPATTEKFTCGTEFLPANNWHIENGHRYALINNLESMDPFFLSIVGAGNHWFFCGSNGALSAGRCSPETALFPYYTVDKILDNWNSTGSWCSIVANGQLWSPFNPSISLEQAPKRRLMKSEISDEVVFEETHQDLELRYTYKWQLSEKFGFVRRVKIENLSDKKQDIRLVDGLDNLMPPSVDNRTQNELSCLTHAYKLSELESNGNLLIHRLAAGITDEAIPLESLLATTVWTTGLGEASTYLTRKDAESYIQGNSAHAPTTIRAQRGAMFLAKEISLNPGESSEWMMVAEINQSQSQINELINQLKNPEQLEKAVTEDVLSGREKLRSMVASADGIQQSADLDSSLYHYQNTLSNILRGGIPADGYTFRSDQFSSYLKRNNQPLCQKHKLWLSSIPEKIQRSELISKAEELGDADIIRLVEEYLPLVLSRRHGDPSRPWNKFAIRLKDEQGEPIVHFEGNWRDIFQNWEALAVSYPDYLGAFTTKFLNASTVDGFNPYRITSEGVDWEIPDEDDPWASIGYWGDHQIIYLLKFLELQNNIDPSTLTNHLNDQKYVFADVPYRLRNWQETLQDPRESIAFDMDRHQQLTARKEALGGDGLLLRDENEQLITVTLAEKLLLPAVIKIAHLVPGGGIWMNTQRPEWNDANNALAGYGLSVVTAGYLYRYLSFMEKLIGEFNEDQLLISKPFTELIENIGKLMADQRWKDTTSLSESDRFDLVSDSGKALETHRAQVYQSGPRDMTPVDKETILEFLSYSKNALKQTLIQNVREDGLYHSYNILEIDREEKKMSIKRLSIMLEGQVSILSSGLLELSESANLLNVLATSNLISERHQTYLLYPDRDLPSFLDANQVEQDQVFSIGTLTAMVQQGDTRIVTPDPECGFRFHSSLGNAYELASKLDELASDPDLAELIKNDRSDIEDLFESTFDHQSFTGRSGSMFGYEGLGCVYWHMVSKLMLAVQEVTLEAIESNAPKDVVQDLIHSYYDVQSGLGFRKLAKDYGAFPAEAYSHSPAHAGAQQPGLTGQVKEGVLCRFGELGVQFENGQLKFRPRILRNAEFAESDNTLSFTIARVPVTYHLVNGITEASASVTFANESESIFNNAVLDEPVTKEIISETKQVKSISVNIPETWMIS